MRTTGKAGKTYTWTGVALVVLALAVSASAQEYEGRTVSAVEIDGLERIGGQVVRAKLEAQAGQEFNARTIARDIRRLYSTGFFTRIEADAALDDGEVILTYRVREKQVVAEVRIIGNRRVKTRKIRGVLTMREGSSFVPEAYNEEREAILGLYEKKGFANATVDMLVPGPVSALGLSETLPAGWALEEVVDAVGAEAVPEPGDSTLEFAWLIMPRFPVRVVYRVAVPGDAGGPQAIIGEALYRTPDSLELSTGILATAVGDAPGGLAPHSVDSNLDWTISLSEILRVIQFFNMDGYQCADGTEDGYAPGLGAIGCLPHTGDYLEQDWAIDLSELLRMVQLFNAPAGAYYVDVAGEDGFSPGLFTLN